MPATRNIELVLGMLVLFAPFRCGEPPSARKFVSADRSFELMVPPAYRVNRPSGSYIPACHDGSLVCITYPPGRYKGTTFGDASVEVILLPAKTEQECVNPGKYEVSILPEAYFHIDTRNPSRIIDGVRFLHSLIGGAASSHDLAGDRYRGFTHGRCYDLTVSATFSNFGVYDPGTIKEFTPQDQEKVIREMTQILDTFHARR